jgi:hypothetical protein
MRRDEVHEIFERVDKQIRAADDRQKLETPAAKKLIRARAALLAKIDPLKRANEALEEQARRMGLRFHRSYGEPEELVVSDRYGSPSRARKRFLLLRDQYRIATLGSTADDVKQQQAILREIAQLAEQNQ